MKTGSDGTGKEPLWRGLEWKSVNECCADSETNTGCGGNVEECGDSLVLTGPCSRNPPWKNRMLRVCSFFRRGDEERGNDVTMPSGQRPPTGNAGLGGAVLGRAWPRSLGNTRPTTRFALLTVPRRCIMRFLQHIPRFLAVLLVTAGLLFVAGCDSTGEMSSGEGQFTLMLTDAPANLDSAVVTVDRVDLVSEDAEDQDAEDGEGEGIITLTDTTGKVDLLQLQGGVTQTLANATVPPGEYAQLRFVLGEENYLVFDDGTKQDLQVPSGQQSGIKIILPEVEIENQGDQIEVTLDFDVDESLVEKGNGGYLFKPTIKVQDVLVNGESIQTVEVDGAVSNAGSGSVSVDSIPFALTDQTEFDGDEGASSPADLENGQFVEVEGTLLDDGTLEAREIDVEGDDEVEHSITAPIEAKTETEGDQSVTLLGVTIEVTSETEFDDDAALSALSVGDRVNVDYTFQDGARVASKIEVEND